MELVLTFPFEESLELRLGNGGIRPLEPGDELPLMQIALQEPELFRYTLHSMKTPEEIFAYFQLAHSSRLKHQEYPFVILHPETAQIIGTTRFYLIQPNQASLAIGYTWIGSAHHGTGLNRTIKQLMLKFVFDTLHFKRIEFRTDSENLRSIRALEGIGAVAEGELRSHVFRPDGTRRNTRILSILKDEYIGNQNE